MDAFPYYEMFFTTKLLSLVSLQWHSFFQRESANVDNNETYNLFIFGEKY